MVYDQESMKDGFAFGLDSSTQTGLCFAISRCAEIPCDRESGLQQKAMSALPSKADMCSATEDAKTHFRIATLGRSVV
jgi:hypothetical protein